MEPFQTTEEVTILCPETVTTITNLIYTAYLQSKSCPTNAITTTAPMTRTPSSPSSPPVTSSPPSGAPSSPLPA
jgi:hypothetical protein